MTEKIETVDDREVGDFVMYQHYATFEENYPRITLTIEKVVDIGIENFKTKKSIILKKHRVKKIIRNKHMFDYQGFDEMYIMEEDNKAEKKYANS